MGHSRPKQNPASEQVARRTIGKLIRFRLDELEGITERAGLCGMPVARYIRQAAVGVTPRVRRTREAAELIRHLAQIGNNLNQLVRLANTEKRLGDERRFRDVLNDVVEAIAHLE